MISSRAPGHGERSAPGVSEGCLHARRLAKAVPRCMAAFGRMPWITVAAAVTRLAGLLLILGLSAVSALAQQRSPDEPYEIFAVVWRGETEVEEGFRAQLSQLGVPANITVRNLNLDSSRAPDIVAEIKRVQPDLVYTWGTGTTANIVGRLGDDDPDRFVTDIPAIFVLVAYPVEAGIVESFAAPGRSVTGVSFLAPVDVQLRAIQAYGGFKRIAQIYDPTAGNSKINVDQLRAAAADMGLELVEFPIPLNADGRPDPDTLPRLVAEADEQGADIIYMGPDSFLTRHSDSFTKAAIAHRLPTFAATQAPLLGSRAMFGLVTDYHTLGRLAAIQSERMLVGGEHPEDLPVGQLSRYKLLINIDVAHEVQSYPPLDMIAVADFRDSQDN